MTANYSTREYREKLYDDLHVRLRDTAILMCAIFIASIGLNMNSTAVIIGAMLISPLMTPIVGLGFGLAIFDTRLIKQSLEVLLTQVLVSLLVSTLYLKPSFKKAVHHTVFIVPNHPVKSKNIRNV